MHINKALLQLAMSMAIAAAAPKRTTTVVIKAKEEPDPVLYTGPDNRQRGKGQRKKNRAERWK